MKDISDSDRKDMDAVLARMFDDPDRVSTSEKIRRLADAGYKTADIARYLDIIYQFAYNVLSAPRPRRKQAGRDHRALAEQAAPYDPRLTEPPVSSPARVWARVDRDGRIALPAAYLVALGAAEGDQVQLAMEGDAVRVLSRAVALRELQAHVRRFVPEGVSLVDELIAERRAEAARETEPASNG